MRALTLGGPRGALEGFRCGFWRAGSGPSRRGGLPGERAGVSRRPRGRGDAPPAEAPEFLKLLHGWNRIERLGVIVSGAPTRMLLDAADRVLELKEGLLTFDGPALISFVVPPRR